MERNKWSGTEWNGMERSKMKCSCTELSVMELNGMDCLLTSSLSKPMVEAKYGCSFGLSMSFQV